MKSKNAKAVLISVFVLIYSLLTITDAQAAPGDLDPSFGVGGKVISADFGGNAIAIQAEGKTVAVGVCFRPECAFDFGLARYNTDGSLDAGFGGRFALVRYQSGATLTVTNVEELYSAVNNPQNAGSQIIIAPGTYMLSVNDPNGAARPNSGRIELQQNMSLQGVVGDRSAVVIDAMNLPLSSFNSAPPVTLTAAIRMGRGSNSIEWLTVRNAVNGNANIGTELASTATNIRVAHIASTNSQRGLDVRNFGVAQAGRTINAEIIDNDFFNNRIGLVGAGLRIVNNQRANGGIVNATLAGNRNYSNYVGLLVENNQSTGAVTTVFSSGNRFFENGVGAVVGGGLSAGSNVANGNTVSFTAYGDVFENNNGFNNFDFGGLVMPGGENTSFPNGTSNNTVNAELRDCRFSNNQIHDVAAFGARSSPVSVGLPGTNNRVTVRLYDTPVPVLETADSIPDYPGGMNSATVTHITASVSGRVLRPDGSGLSGASVIMIDSLGNTRAATASSFGYYSFANVLTGQFYTLAVPSRRYRFAPRIIQVVDTLTDVDLQGQE